MIVLLLSSLVLGLYSQYCNPVWWQLCSWFSPLDLYWRCVYPLSLRPIHMIDFSAKWADYLFFWFESTKYCSCPGVSCHCQTRFIKEPRYCDHHSSVWLLTSIGRSLLQLPFKNNGVTQFFIHSIELYWSHVLILHKAQLTTHWSCGWACMSPVVAPCA